MIDRIIEADRFEDQNLKSCFDTLFQQSWGEPIALEAAPTESGDMKSNTWGYYSTKLYVRFNDGTLLSFDGTAIA